MGGLTGGMAILLATGAAVAAACNSLFVRLGTEEGTTYDAVFVVIVTTVVILLPITGIVYYPEYGLTRRSLIWFAASGLTGTVCGRVFFYSGIERLGASRASPIISANALIATVLGVILLGESLSMLHAAGIVLIVGGVAGIAWETSQENPQGATRRQLLINTLFPLLAAVAYGVEPIFSKFGFAEGTPPLVGLSINITAAVVGFSLYLGWRNMLPALGSLRTPSVHWFVLAGIANLLFLVAYYLALENAPVNVVVPIIISYPLFVLVLSALFMPRRLEHVTWRLAGATIVVIGGVLLITVPL